MGRRVLVTGGAGFIGSHVAERHVAAGDDVWIVDDLSSGREANVPAGARFVQLDIRSPDLAGVFRDAGGFDVVSNHAAQIDVRVSVADPRRDAAVNIDGLLNLLEACMEYGCRRFVYVSSGGVVYGEPTVRPTPETSPKLPLSPYGVSKLAGEQYLHYYANVRGLDYAALRYSNVYGPRQDPHGEAGVVAIFSTRISEGSALSIFGDGRQTRDYVYVGDVAAANVLAATAELPPPVDLEARAWNVGTGVETSVNDLARKLMAAAGRQVPVEMEAARPGELRHSCLDASRLARLGWSPAVTLEQGLGLTYRHITGQEAVA
ncbi:MAG TPA: NAD-dependent epimerase/dehydratase family protein [Longimicrobiales bacterium]|nr:NAD-dependent epimerase/dehydratase family protein [Longimicrobiales bacterium]